MSENYLAGHSGKVIDHANGFDVIECDYCRFKHIMPIPLSEHLKNVYEEEYYSIEKPNYFKYFEEDQEWWQLSYDDRYDVFEKNLLKDKRKILDIGSGPGFFLLRGKERGWETQGIEPSRQAAAYATNLGLNIRNEFLTPKMQDIGSFDVIHMSEVLEHIPNPLEMLELAHQHLNPGGLLCVVVPNDYSPFQNALRQVDGYEPWWLAAPHHINYFEPSSLEVLLKRSGFNMLHTSTTFPIDLFLLMGDNYTQDNALGRSCHGKRKRLEVTLKKAGLNELRLNLYQQFAQYNIGREIVMYGQKV